MKKDKHYRDAYNNPNQYDFNNIVDKLCNAENEKDLKFYSNIITALRHSKCDKQNNTYKYITT